MSIKTDDQAMDWLSVAANTLKGVASGTSDTELEQEIYRIAKALDDMADAISCAEMGFITECPHCKKTVHHGK